MAADAPAPVTSELVVVFRELGDEIIQMSANKQDEVRQALVLDGPDELFTGTI